MKILLIGSNSLIGKNFLNLYKKKLDIYLCTRKDNLKKKLTNIKPDFILNLAGEAKKINKMWSANILIVKELLDYTIKNNNYLLHTGSSSEYGKRNFPTNEKTLPIPASVYESTKSAASMLITGYSRAYKLKSIVVRPYCVYGAYSKKDRLIPIILNSLRRNKKIKIYKGCQDYVYAKDFARALKTLIEKRKNWDFGEIVNVGRGVQYSNLKVVKTLEKVSGKKVKYKFINKFKKFMDSNMWVCNPKHIKKKYGFSFK